VVPRVLSRRRAPAGSGTAIASPDEVVVLALLYEVEFVSLKKSASVGHTTIFLAPLFTGDPSRKKI